MAGGAALAAKRGAIGATLEGSHSIKRLVFAHWHFFPISIDNRPSDQDYYSTQFLRPQGEGGRYAASGGYIRERPLPRPVKSAASWQIDDMVEDLMLAEAIGIDAFQYNLSGLKGSASWETLGFMLEAASRLNSIKVVICLDCISMREASVAEIADALLNLAGFHGLARWLDNRILVSGFAAEVVGYNFWRSLSDYMTQRQQPIALFPVFLNLAKASDELIGLSTIVSVWGGNTLTSRPYGQKIADMRDKGMLWCAPAWTQNFRPKAFYYEEAANSLLFRSNFDEAIQHRAEALNILTWNDYSESSEIRPSSKIRHGFYRLAKHLIANFKADRTRQLDDELIYIHRSQFVGPQQVILKQQQRFKRLTGPLKNEIEVITICRRPALLEIFNGNDVWRSLVPEGLTSTRVPLAEGRPRFVLYRAGDATLSIASKTEISKTADFEDLLYHAGSSEGDV